ncbi:hypothetical protein FRC12_006013 [Ceratobasidium sp. 428]|nr:hypothetical protein FRC12_006013 [Ceratobasidium sp. 428]
MRAHYLENARWEANWIQEATDICVKTYNKFYKPTNTSSNTLQAGGSTLQFGYLSYMSRMYANLSGGSAKPNECPVLQFINGNEWKGLTQIALDVLSMPATSVDVKRAFLFAGMIVGKRRHSLSLYMIQATATLGLYSKVGLAKCGCLALPQTEKAKAKEKAVKEKEQEKAKKKAKEKGKAKAPAGDD